MKYSRNSLEQLKEIDPTTVPNPVSGEVVRGVYQGLHWTRNSAGTIVYPAPASGSANYIQNQNASAQSANMWISGSVKATNHLVSGIASRVWFDTLGVEETNWIGTVNNYDLRLFVGRGAGNSLTLKDNGVAEFSGAATFASTIQATTAKLTNLTDGYLPYHISDASGLGDSNIFYNGTNVLIGTTTDNGAKLQVNGSGYFNGSVTATDFIGSSDITLKENIQVLQPKKINSNYKTFNFIGQEQQRVGVIAQELELEHPEFVRTDDNGIKSVSYTDLHSCEIAYLKDKIKKLEELVNKLMK